jgi:exosortase
MRRFCETAIETMKVMGDSDGHPGGSSMRLSLGICGLLLLGLYVLMPYATGYGAERHSIAYWLWYFWRDPDWQHGALVPPILGVLLWKQRASLFSRGEKEMPSSPPSVCGSWSGLAIIAAALAVYFAGYRANIYYLGYFSAQLLAGGLIVWLAGWRWFSRLLFFWCLLGFLWPLFFLESRLGFPLRMLMTDLSSAVLNAVSVEHVRQGTALLSPGNAAAGVAVGEHFALEVANPCSGIRSLFSLTMVGALFGYLTLRKTWQWMALTASAIPLAVIGNAVRILLLLGASRWFGSEFAVGGDGSTSTFHLVAGIAVFLVALAGMALLVRGLRWMEERLDRSRVSVSMTREKKTSEGRVVLDAG